MSQLVRLEGKHTTQTAHCALLNNYDLKPCMQLNLDDCRWCIQGICYLLASEGRSRLSPERMWWVGLVLEDSTYTLVVNSVCFLSQFSLMIDYLSLLLFHPRSRSTCEGVVAAMVEVVLYSGFAILNITLDILSTVETSLNRVICNTDSAELFCTCQFYTIITNVL